MTNNTSDMLEHRSFMQQKRRQREFQSARRREPEKEKRERLRCESLEEFGPVNPELKAKFTPRANW